MTKRKRHNYRNLDIWKRALDIANEISDLLMSFPRNEQYNLTSQMSRSSVSMPSNIAEGSARTDKSFIAFIDYAIGSSFELGTQLLIAKHRGYINEENLDKFEKNLVEWQKMTMSFQNRLISESRQSLEEEYNKNKNL